MGGVDRGRGERGKGPGERGAKVKGLVNMGAQPPYPLTWGKNRMVRKGNLCGGQGMCEHVMAGKMIASGVCRADRCCYSANRVRPPQESGAKNQREYRWFCVHMRFVWSARPKYLH